MNTFFEDDLHLTEFEVDGTIFTFLLNSRQDHIQQFLARGDFYEREELELLGSFCNGRRRLLDIGANIGNHSIFLAHRLNLERVTPIEPQPAIMHVLKANLGLNWRPSFDLSHLGLALGAQDGWVQIGAFNEQNIGGTRMKPLEEPAQMHGMVRLVAGDHLFRPGEFDIVKIDVEGMEGDVLSGLGGFFKEFDGVIFVEVHDIDADALADQVADMGFRKVDEFRRYKKCTNWILTR